MAWAVLPEPRTGYDSMADDRVSGEWGNFGPSLAVGGDPGLVLIGIAAQGLVVAPYAAEWLGHMGTRPVMRKPVLVPWGSAGRYVLGDDMREPTDAAVRRAVHLRRRRFRRCQHCGEMTPPEYRFRPDECMGCAERVGGVVF